MSLEVLPGLHESERNNALTPVISFKCLSKGQIVLVIKRGSVYKDCDAASQGLTLQAWLLDVWRIHEGLVGPSIS